jgi:hypothetical protein
MDMDIYRILSHKLSELEYVYEVLEDICGEYDAQEYISKELDCVINRADQLIGLGLLFFGTGAMCYSSSCEARISYNSYLFTDSPHKLVPLSWIENCVESLTNNNSFIGSLVNILRLNIDPTTALTTEILREVVDLKTGKHTIEDVLKLFFKRDVSQEIHDITLTVESFYNLDFFRDFYYISQAVSGRKPQAKIPKWVNRVEGHCNTFNPLSLDAMELHARVKELKYDEKLSTVVLDTLLIRNAKALLVDGNIPSWGVSMECMIARLFDVPVILVRKKSSPSICFRDSISTNVTTPSKVIETLSHL